MTNRVFRVTPEQRGSVKTYKFKEQAQLKKPSPHSWFDVRPILENHWFPNRKQAEQITDDTTPANIIKFPGFNSKPSAERKEGVA